MLTSFVDKHMVFTCVWTRWRRREHNRSSIAWKDKISNGSGTMATGRTAWRISGPSWRYWA